MRNGLRRQSCRSAAIGLIRDTAVDIGGETRVVTDWLLFGADHVDEPARRVHGAGGRQAMGHQEIP